MKILYDKKTGKVYYAVKDRDIFWFHHTTNIPLTELEIEETEENKNLCHDVIKNYRKVDENSDGKFTVDNGSVIIKEEFVEKQEEIQSQEYQH